MSIDRNQFNPLAMIAPQTLDDCKMILAEVSAELDSLIERFSALRCPGEQKAEATA